MKIIKSNLLGLLLIAISLFAVSCDKELERSDLTLDNNATAKIIVYSYADIDKTKHGLENVPNGTKAFIKIENSEYNPSASGLTFDTVEVRNGKVEATIKTTNSGVDVEVVIPDFVAKQKQGSASETATLSYLFEGKRTLSKVLPGEERVSELFCTATKMGSEVAFVTRKFKIEAITDVEVGLKEVPNTAITFYSDGWVGEATTNIDGVVEISLPANEDISIVFVYSKRYEADKSRKKYRYRKVDFANFDESHPVSIPLNFGDGELYE